GAPVEAGVPRPVSYQAPHDGRGQRAVGGIADLVIDAERALADLDRGRADLDGVDDPELAKVADVVFLHAYREASRGLRARPQGQNVHQVSRRLVAELGV